MTLILINSYFKRYQLPWKYISISINIYEFSKYFHFSPQKEQFSFFDFDRIPYNSDPTFQNSKHNNNNHVEIPSPIVNSPTPANFHLSPIDPLVVRRSKRNHHPPIKSQDYICGNALDVCTHIITSISSFNHKFSLYWMIGENI